MSKTAKITLRGRAALIAIDEGLIKESDAGYNMDAFNRFWDRIEWEVIPVPKKRPFHERFWWLPAAISGAATLICLFGWWIAGTTR